MWWSTRLLRSLRYSLRGARQRARLYTSTDSLSNDGGPGAEHSDCADCGPRFPPLRPCAPRIATTAAPVRVPRFRPARADGMWDRTIVSCGNKSDSCVYMSEST